MSSRKIFNIRQRLLPAAVVAAMAASAPGIVMAQSANATLRGKGPANATVTAKNVATGAVRVTQTGKDGAYALVGLPPGTYTVDAGAGTQRTVTLSVASVGTLDFSGPGTATTASAANATTLGAVNVQGTALEEVKTSEVGTTISVQQIANLPQITRNFLEFADIVPGMMFQTENGKTSIHAGAQPDGNMNVFIDGVGQKNYVHGGAMAGQAGPNHDGDVGNPFPQLAIGEYKVITSNYKAEFDQISSAAIVAETQSGTNEFHGEAYETFNSSNWRAETPAEEYAGKKTNGTQHEYGGSFGGPIIQDKLHFFVAYEGKSFATPTTTTGSTNTYDNIPQNNFLPDSAKAQLGPTSMPFKENLWFGKLDYEPTTRDRFELSTSLRTENQIYGAGDTTAASALYKYQNKDKHVDARWQHSADSWFNEFTWNYQNTLDQPSPLTDSPATTYFWNSPAPAGAVLTINGQDPRQYFSARQIGNTLQDNLTFNDIDWHGDHVIKMGVKYSQVTLSDRDSSTSADYFYNVGPDGTETTPYEVVFGKLNNGLPLTAVSHNKQFGAYIQDDWDVTDKLQLNLGVRWDYERTPEWLNFHTPQSVLDALYAPTYQFNGQTINNSYAQSLAMGGVNVANYISTGSNRKAQKGEIQPRLGFSYDLNGDEEHVIFGGVGRAYDRNLFGLLSLENTKNALSEPQVYFESPSGASNGSANGGGVQCLPGAANGTTCFVWDPKYYNAANLQGLGSGVGEVDMVNNNLKSPYSDQFSLGMRNKLGDWNITTTFQRINQYDTVVGWLGNRYPNGQFYQNGTQWGSPGVPGIGGLILWDNGGTTYNSSFLVSAEKPYTDESGWGMTIAYTYTHATENHPYQDPSYAFDLPRPYLYPFTTSSVAPKHRLVVSGTYKGPWDIMLGAKLILSTPIPSNTICGVADYGTDECGAQMVDGQWANAWPVTGVPSGGGHFLFGGPIFGYREVDLQATKNVDLGHGFTLQVRADALNVFNFHNYADVVGAYGSNGQYAPYYNTVGNIYGVPRTFKLTADVKF
ncbi:TonB-dependent receptor [Rhodanobacter sp. DHB23]|uniref:TonB-dependent receptor n=1 Tax=Rhodanobacter sp. DHB23 TaxID=2775923 RepID=UPI00177BFE3A|nr:TonB-dependent receptor [Rhodanobacter sp. DHB23]MBD8872684.1 TonB-dependent receptor [Rhodanobacter sp. DHB23]